MSDSNPLVEVQDLKKHFPVRRGLILQRNVGFVRAVDGVSFTIQRGETLGMVGESGCGKTTVGRTMLGLYPATSGTVVIDGANILSARGRDMLNIRRKAQIIFQDPYASLNPRLNIQAIISEPLKIHGIGNKTEQKERVAELLRKVGLDPAYMTRYPHEFSGGQRQRLGIARALALNPKLIVADERASDRL